MARYIVECEWTTHGYMTVDAATPKEAIRKAHADPLPEAESVDGFTVRSVTEEKDDGRTIEYDDDGTPLDNR